MRERSEWETVFERFPSGPMPIVGPIEVLVHDWSKPADGHPRLFKHGALEWLTTGHAGLVLGLYSFLSGLMFWAGAREGLTVSVLAWRGVAGLTTWTLTEYVMHRYAFHFVPHSRAGLALAYLSHGVHHAYPRDPHRLVMPLVVSLPYSVLIVIVGRAIAGAGSYPFLGGFGIGYLAYDLIHYSIHKYEARGGVMQWLRLYHFQHHFASPDRQFGVSSPLWDYVFRTGR